MANLNLNNDKLPKLVFYLLTPLAVFFFLKSMFIDENIIIVANDISPSISFNNQNIDDGFIGLFEDLDDTKTYSEKKILFRDLGVELSGIVSLSDRPNGGYIILNFLEKKIEKSIFKPGDKIDDNVFLDSIYPSYIVVSINNISYQIYLTDKKKITSADSILTLDVSLIEILPYLKIKQGNIKNTPGIYISDRVDGKILEKLHLKETDLLFNLNGYNVFNLATLNDAYRKLQNKKEIVASIYRDGKVQKLVARRIDA